jgi:hypothetical protein
MNIFDLYEQDGTLSISRLLQNSRFPTTDRRHQPQALRDRLADVAIKRMQAQADFSAVDPDWVL